MRIRLITALAFTSAAFLPTAVSAQAWSHAYAMGVNSGFASVQVYERPAELPNHCYEEPAVKLFQSAMGDIQTLVDLAVQEGVDANRPPLEWGENCRRPPDPSEVEAWRAVMQEKMSQKNSLRGRLFALGVNIGIAEAQASLGDSRRQLVYMALQNAQSGAKAFGFDVAGLDECILLAGSTTPMAEIHRKIVVVRSTLQAQVRI